jgi:hypothetical protein
MNIGESTLYTWVKRKKEIQDALKRGREISDIIMENALYKSGIGYEYEETQEIIEIIDGRVKKKKIKHIKRMPPNVTAQIFWLKNRKPKNWRDRSEVEIDASDRPEIIFEVKPDES